MIGKYIKSIQWWKTHGLLMACFILTSASDYRPLSNREEHLGYLDSNAGTMPRDSVEDPSALAHVFPTADQRMGIAAQGVTVFTDQEYVFNALPSCLQGKSYILSAMSPGARIVPVTQGKLFVVTPLDGEKGSQERSLLAQDFVQIDHPSFVLFKGQEVEIGIFVKDIVYEKFRLEAIEYSGWAVSFFNSSKLPSITEAAEVTWVSQGKGNKNARQWQGCPSIAKTGQRLWAAWFSGGAREPDSGNYAVIAYSDDGHRWNDPALTITHANKNVRVMDPQLWKDPKGRLWIFWVQNTGTKGFDGIWGTWAIRMDNPDAKRPTWTSPRRLCNGLTRNKPIVLTSGAWLLPSYDWINHQSAVYISSDQGEHWELQGGPVNEPIQNFYEHMCVQLKGGRIWMLQRHIQESFSDDLGKQWTKLKQVRGLNSANSRLYIGRLQSGNLLLVHNDARTRKHLTARISLDEGKTWPYALMLDERDDVSYPDVVQDEHGMIYVIYDRSRRGEKEILLSRFKEEDVLQGKFTSASAYQKKLISKVHP